MPVRNAAISAPCSPRKTASDEARAQEKSSVEPTNRRIPPPSGHRSSPVSQQLFAPRSGQLSSPQNPSAWPAPSFSRSRRCFSDSITLSSCPSSWALRARDPPSSFGPIPAGNPSSCTDIPSPLQKLFLELRLSPYGQRLIQPPHGWRFIPVSGPRSRSRLPHRRSFSALCSLQRRAEANRRCHRRKGSMGTPGQPVQPCPTHR